LNFTSLHGRLVALLKSRVSNGELTERALARELGISQPHIHNVLKGERFFSHKMADKILGHLGMTALDLVTAEERGGEPPRGTFRGHPRRSGPN
jgi:transcriptional regulator with XRE-family HTH domain